MAKRLQVILQDPEYREIQRAARAQHMSLAEWVRRALVQAADIDHMLAEIEAGYRTGTGA